MPTGSGEPDDQRNFNAHVVIFSLAIVLALATASECHSITHLPSLLYGVVLWGWWACVASAFWKMGQTDQSLCRACPFEPISHSCAGGIGAGRRASAADGQSGL